MHLCAGHHFPLLLLGSHQCAFHRDTEISWGKPASSWKKQAVVASPLEMGKTDSEKASLRRSAPLTGHSLSLRNPLGSTTKICPYHLSISLRFSLPARRRGLREGCQGGLGRPAPASPAQQREGGAGRLSGRCRHGNAIPPGAAPGRGPGVPALGEPGRT